MDGILGSIVNLFFRAANNIVVMKETFCAWYSESIRSLFSRFILTY